MPERKGEIDQPEKCLVTKLGGSGGLAMSFLTEGLKVDDQQLYTPPADVLQAASVEQVEALTDREIRILETKTLNGINEVRIAEELTPLKRIRDLEPAALFGSRYNSTHPENPLTHSVPYDALLAMPRSLLQTVGINDPITENDLDASGMQPGTIARITARAQLAGRKLGREEKNNYAKQGGVSEVAARGFGLTAESIIDGLNNSPPHAAAIRGDYKHAGVIVTQGESGITTISIVLGQGLNTSVNWPTSRRGMLYTTYLPLVRNGL